MISLRDTLILIAHHVQGRRLPVYFREATEPADAEAWLALQVKWASSFFAIQEAQFRRLADRLLGIAYEIAGADDPKWFDAPKVVTPELISAVVHWVHAYTVPIKLEYQRFRAERILEGLKHGSIG